MASCGSVSRSIPAKCTAPRRCVISRRPVSEGRSHSLTPRARLGRGPVPEVVGRADTLVSTAMHEDDAEVLLSALEPCNDA